MEGVEEEKQQLIVKLPVKTPTPEKKTVIKLRLSPEKIKSPNLFSSKGKSPMPESTGNAQATAPHENGLSTKPIAIPPMSPSQQLLSPLAFRGSPEKPPHAFPVNVGV